MSGSAVVGRAPPHYDPLGAAQTADREPGPDSRGGARARAGLNAVTGETGAGKTIFAQAVGLLLGAQGRRPAVGPAAGEAYVEAELDVPTGFFEEDESAPLARAPARGRGRARAGPARLRRRPNAGVRLGACSGTGGSGRGRRAADRDVGPVRAATAGASRRTSSTSSTGSAGPSRSTRRREARVAWRALRSARRQQRGAGPRCRRDGGECRRARALVEATPRARAG